MKNIKFYILALIAGALALNACNEKEDVYLPASEYFVSVVNNTALVVQDGDILKIPVVIAAPKSKAITVTYDFEVNTDTTKAVLGTDFWVVDVDTNRVTNYTLTFPEGTGTDTIYIQAPFTGNTELKKVNLVLKSNTAGYNLGMNSSYAKCVLTVAYPSLDDFVGEYDVTMIYSASGLYINNTPFAAQMARGTGDTLILTNLFTDLFKSNGWTGTLYETIAEAPIKVYVNINSMEFSIPPQQLFSGNITNNGTVVGDKVFFESWDPGEGIEGSIDYGARTFKLDKWTLAVYKGNSYSNLDITYGYSTSGYDGMKLVLKK
jgi:hypothetical protein